MSPRTPPHPDCCHSLLSGLPHMPGSPSKPFTTFQNANLITIPTPLLQTCQWFHIVLREKLNSSPWPQVWAWHTCPPGTQGSAYCVDTPVWFRGFLGILYLDEVGRWHPPLLKVLLPVLLLHLQGKARSQDALGGQAWLWECDGGGREQKKAIYPSKVPTTTNAG